MPRRPRRSTVINTKLQKGDKGTQRQRLLAGVVAAMNRDGYAGTTISAITAEAGVSKPTFYDYFADKDACFLEALADVESRLLALARAHVGGRPSDQALQATIQALVEFATVEPAMARFLTAETLAGGAPALDARERGLR